MFATNVKGHRISFDARGGGSTVVALHSSASTGKQWAGLARLLEGQFCVFTPDLPGYGGSAAVAGPEGPSIVAEAEAIFGLIEAWQEPVHLVGHSYGGAVALRVALRHPTWIKSLTLIEPTLFHLLRSGPSADAELVTQIDAVRDTLRAALSANRPLDGMARFVDFWNGTGSWAGTKPELKARLGSLALQVARNFAALEEDPFSIDDLKALRVPTLVMMGTESPRVTLRTSEITAGALECATLRIVVGGGHMVPLTDPHLVDPAIAVHVKAVDAGTFKGLSPLAA